MASIVVVSPVVSLACIVDLANKAQCFRLSNPFCELLNISRAARQIVGCVSNAAIRR